MSAAMFRFGPFRLIPARRALLENELPVSVGGRAFDILSLLLERAGDVVTKNELIERAWPETCVEEANLRVHVSALRKVLGEERNGCRYIENVAGRGYSFVAAVCTAEGASGTAAAQAPPIVPEAIQCSPQRVIGREHAIGTVADMLKQHSMVTIVGPGGIGKTTLALAVARTLTGQFAQGVCFVDLTCVSDTDLIPSAVASALRLPVMSGQPLAGIMSYLHGRALLLVLDNCEHLADAVAVLAETIIEQAPAVRLLATSRESLRVTLERVYRLPALTVPHDEDRLDEAAMLTYTALALFAERAVGALGNAPLAAAELALVAQICRRLDGMPLAIELAAARLDLLGIRGLAAGLDDCLAVLTRNRRAAVPRHQTLRAVLDWSYELLATDERALLQQLSVYRGVFTLDCARALADPDAPCARSDTAEAVFSLASKSMLVCETSGDEVLYRMLETTRSYAADKLAGSGERDRIRQRHVRRCLDLVASADADWETLGTQAWMTRYAGRIVDIRAALDFSFNGNGERALGVQLMTASSLMWIELSFLDEQRLWILRALPFCDDPRQELRLLAALGNALFHLNGAHEDAISAFARAYKLAKEQGDVIEQARTYSGLCANYLLDGNYPQALALGREFSPYHHRTTSPIAKVIHDRMISLTLHFCGEQQEARRHAERVYHGPAHKQRDTRTSGVQYDQQVAAATVLARVRWVEGYPEDASRLVEEAISRALDIDHAISLCYSLSVAACPVALWTGNAEAADYYIRLLTERAGRHSLIQWQRWAAHFVALAQGDRTAGLGGAHLKVGPQAETLYTLAPGVAGAAEFARVGQGLSGWCAAELIRQKAAAALAAGAPALQVETLLKDAFGIAERQHALAWSLRTATSMALLWRDTGRTGEAHALLAATYRRFSQGHSTRDLVTARDLIQELESAD